MPPTRAPRSRARRTQQPQIDDSNDDQIEAPRRRIVASQKPKKPVKKDVVAKETKKTITKPKKKTTTKSKKKETKPEVVSRSEKVETSEQEPPSRKRGGKVYRDDVQKRIDDFVSEYEELLELQVNPVEKRDLKSAPQLVRKFLRTLKSIRTYSNKIPVKKVRVKSENSKPSGLEQLRDVTDELRDFLGLKKGEMVSIVDVNRAIGTYIHKKDGESRPAFARWAHLNTGSRNLKNEEYGSVIDVQLDDKLSKLLRLDSYQDQVAEECERTGESMIKTVRRKDKPDFELRKDDVTFTNLQKLVSIHFIKK